MTPDQVSQLLTVLVPALTAFLVGHFQIVPKIINGVSGGASPVVPTPPSEPTVTPVTPTAPVSPVIPVSPALPPIGQGGLLAALSLVLQGIITHPTLPQTQKTSAAAELVTAVTPFIQAQ